MEAFKGCELTAALCETSTSLYSSFAVDLQYEFSLNPKQKQVKQRYSEGDLIT